MIDKYIERHIEGLDPDEYKYFKGLCQAVSDYLYQHCTPHTSVVITSDDFVVKEDIVNGYFEMRN